MTMNASMHQLDAIQAMLTAGHRNLRVERHTLLLWGVPPGVLFALSESIFTPDQIPDLPLRAAAWLALIAAGLAVIATLDWRWTRRAKQQRDEAWSFVHRQVIKVQWLFMAMATMATYASFFYGGGYMVCAVWLVFLGLSLFVHGLFSEELLEWVGALCIVMAVVSLLAGLPYETMRWMAAAVFAIGLPLLALMLDRGRHRPVWIRVAQATAWLVIVLAGPMALAQRSHLAVPADVASVSLETFRSNPAYLRGPAAVTLPRGTVIPVEVELRGDVFDLQGEPPVLPLRLGRDVDLALLDGQLTGDVRLASGPWIDSKQVRWIHIPWIKASLTPGQGPVARSQLIVQLQNH